MTITLTRDINKKGCADEWTVMSEGLRGGIGKNRIEALGSFLSGNLEHFGITSRIDIDPESETPIATWSTP